MKIEFEGLEQFTKKVEQLVDANKIEKSMQTACAIVEVSAKKNAPKDTGALRRSIQSKVEREGKEVQGTVFTPLEYAPYVEYGTGLFAEGGGRKDEWSYQDDKGDWYTTRGQKPQPFMRPALNENREKIVQIIKEGMLNG